MEAAKRAKSCGRQAGTPNKLSIGPSPLKRIKIELCPTDLTYVRY